MANGIPLPKAGVFAEAMGQVAAQRIAAALKGQEPQVAYDGEAGCFLEVGDRKAVLVHERFMAQPLPQVTLTEASEEYVEAKRIRTRTVEYLVVLKGRIMIERIEISGVIIASGIALYWGWVHWQLWRLRRTTRQTPGLSAYSLGQPAILYFSSPGCVPCRTAQEPALQALQEDCGARLQVIEIDASDQPSAADYWGVLSVPTTFVIDHQGRPRHVNNGVASTARLRGQLIELGEWREESERTGQKESNRETGRVC